MFLKSYKSAFISLFLVLLLVTVASIVYNAYWRTSDAILELSRQIIAEASQRIIDRTDFIFTSAENYLYINRQLVTHQDIIQEQDKILALFWQQLHLTPEIVSIYAADSWGNFVQARLLPRLSTRVIDRRSARSTEQIIYRDQNYQPIAHIKGNALYDPRERPWYHNTGTELKVYVTEIYRFSSTDKPGVTVTIPILDERGEINTIIGVDITLDSLSVFLAEQRIAGGGVAMIIDDKDRLIAFPYQLKLRALNTSALPEGVPAIEDLADQWLLDAYRACKVRGTEFSDKSKSAVVTSQTNGQRYVAQMQDFSGDSSTLYRLFTVVPESALLSSAERIQTESFVISIIILIVSIIAVYALAVRFSEPIIKLAENTVHMKQLRLDEVKPVESGFPEIQTMDASIRDMKQGLEALQKYVPSDLVSSVITSGKEIRLGCQLADLTLFISKMSGFSKLCCQLPVAEITEIMTRYLDEFSTIIKREKGTIDKYMGDRIMAFWGAPLALKDGPDRACRAALLCVRSDREIDRELAAANQATADSVFGIHSGEAIVGNLGSSDRMSYTAMGVNVEIAWMLRNLNYNYGTSILISDATYKQVEGLFICRRVDMVRLRDDIEPMTVYELLAERDTPLATETLDYIKRYESALSQYQQGAWDKALAAFQALAKILPDDKAVRFMLSRLEKIQSTSRKDRQPPDDWDGVSTLSI